MNDSHYNHEVCFEGCMGVVVDKELGAVRAKD